MIHILLSILGIIVTILFVIGTHESAHFLMARAVGVKVLRFSIGFGKTLFRWHDRSGTEYVFALLPLGGYVKMLDETEGNVPASELPYAYNRQPFYKKFLIVLAGPAINLICAFLLYWLIFTVGFVSTKPLIGSIAPRSIAAEAGMQPHQEIIMIDGRPAVTWIGTVFRLLTHAGNQDKVKIETKTVNAAATHTFILDLSNWHMSKLTPDPLSSLGIIPYEPEIPLVIGFIKENSPAASANLKMGDKLIALNHTPIKSWVDIVTYVTKQPDTTVMLTIERTGKKMTVPVVIGSKRNFFLQKSGYLGIGPIFQTPKELLQPIKYTPIAALSRAGQEIADFTYFNFLIFGKMFTGKLSLESLGGPITIFESAGDALNYGFIPFVGFLAFLSLSVGIINLLPIPGLDGGLLFMQLIEFIIRRPIPERVQLTLYRIGFLFIIFVLIQALVNDILRIY